MWPDDTQRYKCQLNLPEVGVNGQRKLASSKVLCIGAGGLANSALPYLAAAGIGSITVLDGDCVSLSNLHRQVLFNPQDVGKNKAVVMCHQLQIQNPTIKCLAVPEYLDLDNADLLIQDHDIILDCSDNYFTRYLISDLCHIHNKPDIFAGVIGFEGYITIFSVNNSPCYRCLYAKPPKLENVSNCSDLGVLGTAPGIFGLMQATEAIKFALGLPSPLLGHLIKINFLDMTFTKRKISHSDDCCLCVGKQSFAELQHFEHYETHKLKKISPADLHKSVGNYFCIDVREPSEYSLYNLGFMNMPFSQFTQNLREIEKVDRTHPLLVCCAHGIRSKTAAILLKDMGFENVSHLEGGLEQYRALYDNR